MAPHRRGRSHSEAQARRERAVGDLGCAEGTAALSQQASGRATTEDEPSSLSALVGRVPEGWTRATYNGRAYGLARTTRVGGRSITISAEELGGTDLISANVYRTATADHLRACEMPTAKVLAFLRAWTPG